MELQQPVNLELFLQLPVNIQQLAIATVSLPLVAFAFCVGYSFQYNFDVRLNFTLAFHRNRIIFATVF